MPYRFLSIQEKYYLTDNVWKDNVWLKYVEPFKSLYDRDASDNKEISSKEVTCIWLYCDPSYQNKIGKLKEEQKKNAIKAFYHNFDFEDDTIGQCIASYPELCLSETARSFQRHLKAIERLQDIVENKMENEELTLDTMIPIGNNRWMKQEGTAKQLLDLKAKVTKTWKDLIPIQKQFEEEQTAEGKMYGGGQRTLMDEGGMIPIDD